MLAKPMSGSEMPKPSRMKYGMKPAKPMREWTYWQATCDRSGTAAASA